MLKPFDTHAHLSDKAFSEDFDDVLARTLSACSAVMTIGCETLEDFAHTMALSRAHKQIFAAIALHPQNAPDDSPEIWQEVTRLARDERVRAIGETGLDYHWMTAEKDVQKALFTRHIELAKEVKKPLIIHDREAHRDTLDTLWANGAEAVGGILHAYSGSVEMMKEVLAHGFYIGIGGVVTFKNAKTVKEVAKAIPLDRLLIETDCPYLTPTPFRGKRNEPSYVRYVAETIADLRDMSYEEVVQATYENACRLYSLDPLTLSIL